MIPGTFGSRWVGGRSTAVPTFIGNAGEYAEASGDPSTITFHASTTTGDFMLLVVQLDDPYIIATPSGWTRIMNRKYGSTCRGMMFWKFNAGETTLYLPGSSDHRDSTVLTFRGVDTVDPINAIDDGDWGNGSSPNTQVSGAQQAIPGITTTVDNCYFMTTMFHCYPTAGTAASGWSNSNINSGTELADFSTSLGWDGGFACWGGGKLTAGATGSTTVTMLANNYNGPYNVLALNPS